MTQEDEITRKNSEELEALVQLCSHTLFTHNHEFRPVKSRRIIDALARLETRGLVSSRELRDADGPYKVYRKTETGCKLYDAVLEYFQSFVH